MATTTHWAPNRFAARAIERRVVERRGVDRDLVRAGTKQHVDVGDAPDTAADGERDEHAIGGATHRVEEDRATVARRRDVEEHELVSLVLVISGRKLRRVAGIAQVDERHSFDHPPGDDVEARDHALGERHQAAPLAAAERIREVDATFVERLADDRRRLPRRRRMR